MTNETETAQKTASGRQIDPNRNNSYLQHIGIVRCVPQEGDSQTELVVKPYHMNRSGLMHGGAIFSLVDSCMAGAMAKYLVPPQFCATIECKINYLKAVRGGTLLSTSRVVQSGGRLAVIETDVRDSENGLIARALATYMVMTPKGTPKDKPAAAEEKQ